ncbi:hypothetical protein IT157_08345 [bacterium]|nr:hypothetical protein [bacterium]
MKTRTILSTLLATAWLLILGCGGDSQSRDDIPPQKPIWVQRSSDQAYAQSGIRPEPVNSDRAHWVRLEWQRNPEEDLEGYRVRRWSEHTNLTESPIIADLTVGLELVDGQILSWIDRGLDENGTNADLLAPLNGMTRGYWWVIQAYDTAGNRSQFSDSVYYRLLDNPYEMSVDRAGPDNYVLSWFYPVGSAESFLSFYKIRVYSRYWGSDSLAWDYLVTLYTEQNSVTLQSGGASAPMMRDCTYVWQLNAISNAVSDTHDVANAGAATYTTFLYQE